MGGPIGKTTFAHNKPIGHPPMAIVQGAFSKALLSPGLAKEFLMEYKLGFTISQELLDDDLYSGKISGRPNLHPLKFIVSDLDGMLVPCDLLEDLF